MRSTCSAAFLLLFLSLFAGCQSALTAPFIPPTPTPDSMEAGVFTPDALRRRVLNHPAEHRILIDSDTAILFSYPHPIMDWAASAFLIHIPTMSEVGFDRAGEVQFEHYGSEEAEQHLTQILSDANRRSAIRARINALWNQE